MSTAKFLLINAEGDVDEDDALTLGQMLVMLASDPRISRSDKLQALKVLQGETKTSPPKAPK